MTASTLLGGRGVVVAHPWRGHLRETAAAYAEAGRLTRFLTRRHIAWSAPLRLAARLSAGGLRRRAQKALEYHEPAVLARHGSLAGPGRGYALYRLLGTRRVERPYRRLGFGDAALALAEDTDSTLHVPCLWMTDAVTEARRRGLRVILDQNVGHRPTGAAILRDEARRWDLPADDMAKLAFGYEREKIEPNEREAQAADLIVVGSPFARRTFIDAGYDAAKVLSVHYGAPTGVFARHPIPRRGQGQPLAVAFVGSYGFRKGLPYLLRAVADMAASGRSVELHLFGHPQMPEHLLEPHASLLVRHGHLSRDELSRRLATCHVKALPSLWEGSSYSVYEAMSAGLPPIVTPNVGAICADGVSGVEVPVRDPGAIADALIRLHDDEPGRLAMGQAARERACRFDWSHYRRNLRQALGIDRPDDRVDAEVG